MHNREPAVSASFQEMRTVLDTLPPDGYNRDVAERLFVMDWQNLGKALAVSRYLARAKTYGEERGDFAWKSKQRGGGSDSGSNVEGCPVTMS